MYNPDLLYVTANLEETRFGGVAPGNPVELQIDAFAEPFRGRVVWLDKSTGAQFALMPRNVVSGEFTKVVQRVPVRIAIEKDDRWPLLRAGLSVQAVISHGAGDPRWAEQACPGNGGDRLRVQPGEGVTAWPSSRPHRCPRHRRRRARAATGPWLAAIAIVPILATVYQTLVLTDVTTT